MDRQGLEVLRREECLRLLRRAHIGRVALSVDSLPAVLPVNFTLVGDDVVFRTRPGAKLDAAIANNVVAFEVDDVDPIYHTGWSVLVQGVASEVVDPQEIDQVRRAPLRAWAGDGRDRFVRIDTACVSGRRIARTTRTARVQRALRAVEACARSVDASMQEAGRAPVTG